MNELMNSIAGHINTDPFLIFFGTFYIIIGFSAFLAPKSWEDFIDLFIENDALSLIMGILLLPIALFIVVFYNNWESLGSTILMVIGFLGIIKALVLLIKPSWMQAILKKDFVRKWIWLDGISGIAIGLALLIL